MKVIIFCLAIMIAECLVPPPSFSLKESPRTLLCLDQTEDHKTIMSSQSDFRKVRYTQGFVDKTLFIKDWINIGTDHLYITAPRRFGKSTVLSTVQLFFQTEPFSAQTKSIFLPNKEARELFKDLKIMEDKQFFERHFQKYSVIYVNLASLILAKDSYHFKKGLCRQISIMFSMHSYLKDYDDLAKKFMETYGNEQELILDPENSICLKHFDYAMNSGNYLLKWLTDYVQKPVILLADEYDTILALHLLNKIDFRDSQFMIENLGLFMKGFTKPEEFPHKISVNKTLCFGSLNIGGMISQLANNIEHVDFFSEFRIARHLGLTNDETDMILKKFDMLHRKQEVEDWYDGYAVQDSTERLYNIVTVLCFVKYKEAKSYVNALSPIERLMDAMSPILTDNKIVTKFMEILFKGQTEIMKLKNVKFPEFLKFLERLSTKVVVNGVSTLQKQDGATFFTFLLELGLLTVVPSNVGTSISLTYTNYESAEFLTDLLDSSKYGEKNLVPSEESNQLLVNAVKSLKPTDDSVVELGESLNRIIKEMTPYNEYDYLAVFYNVIRSLQEASDDIFSIRGQVYAYLTNETKAEMKAKGEKIKQGLVDHVIILKKSQIGIIIEGKYNRSAKQGLKQIIVNKYWEIFKSNEFIRKVGIKHEIFIGVTANISKFFAMEWLIDCREEDYSKGKSWKAPKNQKPSPKK